jgi:putative holliday junction resolvase
MRNFAPHMTRILSIDYGKKRTGLAVTDPLHIAVHPLATVKTHELFDFLKAYLEKEQVAKIVLGMPYHPDGNPMPIAKNIQELASRIKKAFKDVEIDFQDESGTSGRAMEVLIEAGVPRMKRREKERLDQISAVLILQTYLGHI